MRVMSNVQAIVNRLRNIRDELALTAEELGPDDAETLLAALDTLRSAVVAAPGAARTRNGVTAAVARRELQRSLELARHTFDDAPVGIFRLNHAGAIVSVNEAACRSLGYDRSELEALTVFDIDPNLTPSLWQRHRTQVRAGGGERTLESRHQRKDGTVFPVEVSVRQFEFDGELFSLSFVKDISGRVRAEQERQQLEARMVEAQRLESLGVLAGGIAHDFNNLLMVILGNLELAMAGLPASGEANLMLGDANRAAQNAADLCRQLLAYAGQGTSELQPVELAALLREQAQMLELSASRSTRLVLDLPERLPILQADASQLRQVIMNLIINASDAIGDAAGEITLRARSFTCDHAYLDRHQLSEELEPGPYVMVTVSDNGSGMDAETASKVFDPFFTTKATGRGLGLAAVRGIVKSHRGAIHVTSEPGKGTLFDLLLPVPRRLSTSPPAPIRSHAWRGEGLVLLVDDEALLRELGLRMLERLGFDVAVAASGPEAIRFLEQHRMRVRHVLLDWTMPDMGGRETLAELRRIRPELGVVVTSGNASEDILSRVDRETPTAFVGKPYRLDDLATAFQLVQGVTRDAGG